MSPPEQLSFASIIPVSAKDLFDWHARPGAFDRLVAPWDSTVVVEEAKQLRDGERTTIRVRLAPLFWKTWVAELAEVIDGRQFCDDQVEGPFVFWEHLHQFEPQGESSSLLEDRLQFVLPGGPLGRILGSPFVRRKIERIFAYRHRLTRDDLREHARAKHLPRQKVLVSGASGLVGSSLSAFLSTGGHRPVPLVRSRSQKGVHWNPERGELNPEEVEGFDAVVHLAGENIAAGRWTAARKQAIRDSRVNGTRLLCETLAKAKTKPKVLVCASAIGYYGERGEEEVDETSTAGTGFLPEVCREWEAATAPARDAGIRVVNLRFGVVLSMRGGALQKMLTPFLLGGGGKVGNGRQWMSWIALDDAVGAIHHAIITDGLAGPVNAVAPESVTNAEFTRTLGRVLSRPTILPLPAFAARLAFGELADALLLASTNVAPKRLTDTGYPFRFHELEPALRHLLGRPLGDA